MNRGKLATLRESENEIPISGFPWRKLCLSGHWIQDALILRWGELTSEISRQAISPSEVIDRLLRVPVWQRNVDDARRVYASQPDHPCRRESAPRSR